MNTILKLKTGYIILFLVLLTLIPTGQYIVNKYHKNVPENNLQLYKHKDFEATKNFLLTKIKSPYLNINYEIKKGDSLKKILENLKIENKEINEVIKLLKNFTNPNNLITKNIINLVIKKDLTGNNELKEIIFVNQNSSSLRIYKDNTSDKFFSEKVIQKFSKKKVIAENIIKNNLYSSAVKEGVDPNIIIEFARVFGFEIDFQRDIRKNDKFQILYEKFFDDNGDYVKSGSILFAYMSVNGREISLYKFGDDRNYGYFDKLGKSVERALMKTPINGARLSSPFGIRKHPILGYNKMHKGTDFAAKHGTPIIASGTGTVVSAKWNGGYGNYIKIRHNSSYQTAYAHLSKFARKIKVGAKVRQGEIIGYVGSTGNSTGSHLHYEVIFNNKKINSQKLKLPSGKVLKGKDRELFELHRIKTDVLISEVILNLK